MTTTVLPESTAGDGIQVDTGNCSGAAVSGNRGGGGAADLVVVLPSTLTTRTASGCRRLLDLGGEPTIRLLDASPGNNWCGDGNRWRGPCPIWCVCGQPVLPSFTLSATVRNSGNGSSVASTLRYYRSSDATISTSDMEVGTDAVSGLPASGGNGGSIDLALSVNLAAPSNPGTYYYGACVDAVSGESDTGNNCSAAVSVTVASQPPPPPTTVASKLYWTDWGTDKIQRADLDGSNVEDLVSSAGLNGPDGLALDMAGGKMYWTDAGTSKIHAPIWTAPTWRIWSPAA